MVDISLSIYFARIIFGTFPWGDESLDVGSLAASRRSFQTKGKIEVKSVIYVKYLALIYTICPCDISMYGIECIINESFL